MAGVAGVREAIAIPSAVPAVAAATPQLPEPPSLQEVALAPVAVDPVSRPSRLASNRTAAAPVAAPGSVACDDNALPSTSGTNEEPCQQVLPLLQWVVSQFQWLLTQLLVLHGTIRQTCQTMLGLATQPTQTTLH